MNFSLRNPQTSKSVTSHKYYGTLEFTLLVEYYILSE